MTHIIHPEADGEFAEAVGFAGESVVVSGFFGKMNRDRLEAEASPSSYGDGGRLYAPRGGKGPSIATWGDGLVLMGDEASLHRSIDQLEGRAPPPPDPPISPLAASSRPGGEWRNWHTRATQTRVPVRV